MDAETVGAMLSVLRNLGRATDDPVGSHDMYDAVLEFPQSEERFERVANIREWRSRYPGSVTNDIRRIRGADDIWVAEMTVSYDGGEPRATESTFSRSGTAGSCARRSTSANRSPRPCPTVRSVRQTSIGSGGFEAPSGWPTATGSDVVGKSGAHV